MKTKHILTALALPALFAACTAEDIVNEGAVALQERPTVENLTVRVIEGAESRYAVNGTTSLKFNFENGDKFGAAIIDQYDPSYPTRPDLWDVIPSLAGNTPFTFNATAGEWKAPEDLPMGLGHYLFVYPYNRADVNRAAVSYELPAVQKLYTEEDGEIDLNAAIEAGNKSFYSTVVTSPDVEDLEIPLENLYAYPKFVINFDNGEKVTTVSKVVLAKKGGFEVKGGFNHEVVAALFANEADSKFWTSNRTNAIDKTTNWDLVQTADLLTSDENYATIETSPYLVAELPLDAEVEKVTNNKVIEVRFMIPGVLMNSLADFNDYEMYIYTDNGVYAVGEGDEDFEDAIAWKNTTKTSSKLKAFARGTANTITIDKNYVVKAENEKYIVTNIADWNALVEQYGDEDKFDYDYPINVTVVGGTLVLDETAEMPTEAYFHVNAVTVKGDVELCNVIADEVIVSEDATLTTCATFEASYITNYGELVVDAVYNKNKSVNYVGAKAIDNHGSMEVVEGAIATFHLANRKGATLANNGAITVTDLYAVTAYAAAADEVQSNGGNNGVINNAGTINMNAFTNLEAEWKNGRIVNMPTINNEGKILTKGDVLNFGTVINEGTLSCKNQNGTFVNEVGGLLDAKEDGLTYITQNKGEIIVYAPFQEDVVIEYRGGVVSYTTSKGSEAFKTTTGDVSYVTNLIISDDYTITAGEIKVLQVEGDAAIALTKNADGAFVSSVGTLKVLKGTTVLGTAFNLNNVFVEEDAMIKVPENISMNVSGSNGHGEDGALTYYGFYNKGEVEVAGSLYAPNISGNDECVGIVTETGADSGIYWKENANDDAAKKTKKEMLADALIEYMDDEHDGDYQKSFELKVAEVNAHLNNIQKYNLQQRYPYGDKFFDKYAEGGLITVSEKEIADAATYIKTEGKKDLVDALKAMEITFQDNKLYETLYKADGVTVDKAAKTRAYEAFVNKVVTDLAWTNFSYSEAYVANGLSEADIDAILAEAAPYAYIWEGSDFYELVKIWVSYQGMTKSDYDFGKALAKNEVNVNYLREFMLSVKKSGDTEAGSAEAKEIYPLISNWTTRELHLLDYTPEQVKACAKGSYFSITGKNPTW